MVTPRWKNVFRGIWSSVKSQYESASSPDSFLRMAETHIGADPRDSAGDTFYDTTRTPISRGKSRPRQDFSEIGQFDRIWWAGHMVPLKALQHVCTLGSPGSGKTLHGSCTFGSLVEAVLSRRGRKLIVFDTKGDYRRYLEGIRLEWELPLYYQTLNVSDLLCSGWDIAADFNEYSKLYELGFVLFPDIKGDNAFFQDAARAIAVAVMSSFTYRFGSDWTLADLYNALTLDIPTLSTLLEGFPRGGDIINLLLNTEAGETLDNIRMNLLSRIDRLVIPAAHAQKTEAGLLSLREFLESPSDQILVISQDLTAEAASRPLVQAAFKRLTDFINARDGVEIPPDTFIFIDELEFIGLLPGLQKAANFGRGKGLILFLLSQSLEGLHRFYGKESADTILGDCPYKAFFRSDSLTTAQWIQNLIGQREVWELEWSTSYSLRDPSVSCTRKRKLEHPVLASDLRKLPKPTIDGGLHGIFLSEEYGDEFWKTLPSGELSEVLPPSANYETKPIESNDQIIEPWSPARKAQMVHDRRASQTPEPSLEDVAKPVLSMFEKELRAGIFDLFQAKAFPLIEEALRGRLTREE